MHLPLHGPTAAAADAAAAAANAAAAADDDLAAAAMDRGREQFLGTILRAPGLWRDLNIK